MTPSPLSSPLSLCSLAGVSGLHSAHVTVSGKTYLSRSHLSSLSLILCGHFHCAALHMDFDQQLFLLFRNCADFHSTTLSEL